MTTFWILFAKYSYFSATLNLLNFAVLNFVIFAIFDHFRNIFYQRKVSKPPQNCHKIAKLNTHKIGIDTCILHISTNSNEIRGYLIYLITITLLKKEKKYSIRLLLFIFTKIWKLNTYKMFYNHQIAKVNALQM